LKRGPQWLFVVKSYTVIAVTAASSVTVPETRFKVSLYRLLIAAAVEAVKSVFCFGFAELILPAFRQHRKWIHLLDLLLVYCYGIRECIICALVHAREPCNFVAFFFIVKGITCQISVVEEWLASYRKTTTSSDVFMPTK
jgi:hypothetical protein